MNNKILFVLIISFCAVLADVRPGIRVRVTEKGLNYINNFALENLIGKMKSAKIPDTKKTLLGSTITLSNIKIEEMPETFQSTMTLTEKVGFSWNVRNLTPKITIKYSFKLFWSTYTGTINVQARKLGFKLKFSVKKKGNKPHIKVYSCSPVGNVQLSFDNSIFNAASSYLEETISEEIKNEICNTALKEINNEAQTQIDKLNMVYNVQTDKNSGFKANLLFDFGLTGNPVFKPHFANIPLKGQIYINDSRVPPFREQPVKIPEFSASHSKMAYIFLTSHVVNSALHSLYHTDNLKYVINQDLLPEKYKKYMETTCEEGAMCLGKFFEEVKNKYPNKILKAVVKATESPKLKITDGQLLLSSKFECNVTVNSGKRDVVLMTTEGKLNNLMVVKFQNERVKFKIYDLMQDVKLKSSNVEKLKKVSKYQFMIGSVVTALERDIILPYINKKGEEGIPLSEFGSKLFSLSNTKIINSGVEDVLAVGTDIYLNSLPTLKLTKSLTKLQQQDAELTLDELY
ncbi:DgyrCDS4867 [Dimorphilus gyrociliatus]|uniref:DgyrCDS4867 n=1 Tax=Dimorphilus gyrociliatus TaxID=2664684 RepID=A0A7I8VKV7_9ANNE|nr:DgyrCDS4867 [Dimorphilus gyrociliatus]